MANESLQGKNILLGVSGGIACYKSADICRQLIRAGAKTRVIMTRSACEFVAPLTFETLSGGPVYSDMFDTRRAWEIEHISFARWGNALLVAPATANILAKMAAGIADDPLTTTALAFRGPIVAAPAMNTAMWEHPQTQENVRRLRERGVRVIAPESGELACGEQGAGRIPETSVILSALADALAAATALEAEGGGNLRVLITAGPTAEPLDPVRHLTNHASGRTGIALAHAALERGAKVTLVLGPTRLEPPRGAQALRVRTAREMADAVLANIDDCDLAIFSAAPADYAPANPSLSKIKKEKPDDVLHLDFVRTPDIAALAAERKRADQVFIGFAAETQDLVKNAQAKMRSKKFDLVVANLVSEENPAFGAAENAVTLVRPDSPPEEIARCAKEELALRILDAAQALLPKTRKAG